MQCEQCGAEVDAKSLYCPQCGNRLVAAAANETASEPTAHDRFRQVVSNRQRNGDDPEQPLWEGSYSPKAMIGAWIGAGVVTLIALVCGVLFLQDGLGWSILLGLTAVGWLALALTYLYRKFSVGYSLTTQRFIHQRGLLWRTTDRVELIDIDDITFTQGPIERMLDVGTIRMSSSDKTHPEFTMPGIDSVGEVAGIIDDERRKERRRRGLHIEAV